MPRKTKTQPGAGGAYGNRTDKMQPPTAAPNQAYGEAGEQLQAQEAMPLPESGDPFSRALQEAQGFDFTPGPPLNAPSERPLEANTTGLRAGPGAGPEALSPNPRRLSEMLTRVASETRSPVVIQMMQKAKELGL